MKKRSMFIVTCITLVLAFVLSACGDGNAAHGANNPDGATLSIEEIEASPQSHLGEITLVGIVGSVSSQEFTLQTEMGTFEVTVNYRGSQALPETGEMLAVGGQLSENRPCCGPGFTLTSTRFERVNV